MGVFIKTVCFCVVLILCLDLVCGQYFDSPCPGVFDFESDGHGIYGKVTLHPSAPVSYLLLRINFTVAAQLHSNYVGRVEADDSNRLLQNYNNGIPVGYRVHFPITSPLPKLTALTVNDNTICYGPGDFPRPNTYITTLSLQHTSFLKGEVPAHNTYNLLPGQLLPQRPQSTRPTQQGNVLDISSIVEQLGDDGQAQVFTFNNIEPTWSTGDSPYYVVNNSRPNKKPTQTYPKPSTPVFHQPDRLNYDHYEYDQNAYDMPKQPIPNRHQTYKPPPPYKPPVYTTTRRPVFTNPAPTPRPQDDSFYEDRVTARPPTQTTQSPASASSATECGIISGGNEKLPLIFNGKSYERGDVPWLVAIYKNGGGTLTFICGGTLVSNRHVVTAAHCMHLRSELTSIKDFVVKVGVHNLNDWADDITVTRTLISAAIHESFNSTSLENDILVFTLNKRVEFNTYIRAACLWTGNTELSRVVGASGVVAGWGDQSKRAGLGEPQMVRIPIVSTAVCRASKPHFHQFTSANTLCAGDRNGSGPCRGDSGGGLYLLDNGKWRLRGVISVALRSENGDNTCNLNEYVVFTDTAQYLTWIRNVISENYFD